MDDPAPTTNKKADPLDDDGREQLTKAAPTVTENETGVLALVLVATSALLDRFHQMLWIRNPAALMPWLADSEVSPDAGGGRHLPPP